MKITLALIWTALWLVLSEFLIMPTLALTESGGIYFSVFFYALVLAFILNLGHYRDDEIGWEARLPLIGGLLFLVVALIIGVFGTWGLFHADDYQQLIGKIEETEFTSNIQPVTTNQMLIVDEEMARRIGEKELGTDPGLGSRTQVGSFILQTVKGKLYWIAPLEHSGFWKWNSFGSEGTPGYIRVSATNQEDYGLIKKAGDKDIHIIFQTQGYFGDDLERHIYNNGYRSIRFSDYTFEVDDEGNPFWTVTLFENKVGFGGSDAIGVLTVNPESGEIKRYAVQDAPNWIDRIQPENFVASQVDDWGNYVHGFWNWAHRDIKRVAPNSSLVLGSDGRSYFYFGLTSSGKENSTIGFAMVDTRTKKTHWFKQAGATEEAAKKSAEGKVQEKGYVGSEGITYNINGFPTYEFLLKDKGGLMKLIALVNVHDHTIVGVGENRHDAIQDYRTQMTNRGNTVSVSGSNMEIKEITSYIERFSQEVIRGNTYYHFTVRQNPKIIFNAGSNISTELPLTREGDPIKISYILQAGEISIQNFDNLSLSSQKDSLQVQNENEVDSLRVQKIEIQSDKTLDSEWGKMTPEEKRKVMDNKK